MKKILLVVFIFLMAMCLISGCLQNKDDLEIQNGNDVKNENQVEKPENDLREDIENKRISETGIYVGQIDNNFIEVKVNGKPISFMLTDETKKTIEKIKENEKIDIIYYENKNGQFVLVAIIQKDLPEETFKIDKGIYVGQLDNFSIEVQVGGSPKVFINYEMDKLLRDIEEGDKVEMRYTENEHGQLNLESIKKVE